MSIQHPVFLQRQEKGPKGKVILVAVVDAESVGLINSDNQVFVLASTTISPYTRMNPTITLEASSKMTAKEFVKEARRATGDQIEDTQGKGISGILQGPYWFIRKYQTIIEQMG
jgi:hypothetical protein